MKMRKFKFLSLLIASTMLFACNSNTSSTAGGNSTPTPTAKPTTSAGDVSLPAGVSTIAQAQAQSASTVVTVWGVVVNVTTKSLLIADKTGKIVIWLNNEPTNTVGQYLQVRGALAERYGNMQFTSSATITVLDSAGAPNVTETAITWTNTEIDTFVNKSADSRGIGAYVSITGKLSIIGDYYNFYVDGTDNYINLAYATSSITTGLVSGNNYKFTGYVTDVSSGSIINLYTAAKEVVAFAAIESVAVVGGTTATSAVGKIVNLETTIAPFLANYAVTWSSSDTSIATVDSYGVLTAKATGSVTITATTVGVDATSNAKTATVTYTIGTAPSETVTTVSFTASELSLDNAAQWDSWTSTDTNITVAAKHGSGTNTVKYYNTGSALRFYKDCGLVFTAKAGYAIREVRITTVSNYYLTFNMVTRDNCYLSTNDADAILQPIDDTKEFSTSKITTGHYRVSKVEVDYFAKASK